MTQVVRMSDGCGLQVKMLGDKPNAPLMIAHHGSPGLLSHVESEASWGGFADIFRVLVFDARGCGDSDKQRPFTHARWVEDLDELRRWAGAEKFVMAGSSHGGFLTLDYAVKYQQHLYGIIVGDSSAYIAGWGVLNALATPLTDPRAINPDPKQLMRVWSGTMTSLEDMMTAFVSVSPLYAAPAEFQGQSDEDVGKMMENAIKPDVDTTNAAHSHGYTHYDVRDQLQLIKVPAFVFCGRHDWICPVHMSEEIIRGLAQSTFVVYERSGHMAALEEKIKFQKDVREWLPSLHIP